MPKYVIERQYLLPIYQRLIIDAPDITTACQEAVENDDWESAEEDGDGSGATTINAAREIPEGLLEQIERGNICESAWNKDPVSGVIGIQSGPPGRRVHNGFHGEHGGRVGDANRGDDCQGSSGLFH